MSNSKVIVTLAVGEPYYSSWQRVCRAGWQAYAERHGYDVICLDYLPDTSPRGRSRSPSWQKCLILGLPEVQRYERVVWVDSDILINPDSPDIASRVPLERVGAVDEFALPTPGGFAGHLARLQRLWDHRGTAPARSDGPRQFYTSFGLRSGFDQVVQAGVLVLSPRHHREVLEHTYYTYEDKGHPFWLYEMRPLSYELLKAGLPHWLDWRFNRLWMAIKATRYPWLLEAPDHPQNRLRATEAYVDNYFLHFASLHNEIGDVDQSPEGLAAARERLAQQRRPRAVRPPPEPLTTPVALLLFNRPDETARVFEVVRQARPPRLLLVADGPRPDQPADSARCAAAREAASRVDWPCEVSTNFAETNLGLKRRVESGLNWVFEQVESAIILEDDCVVEPSFFQFAQQLLRRYADNEQVLAIGATNFAPLGEGAGPSYAFSRYPLIWGWATWRRAWQHYDPHMADWPRLRDSGWLEGLLGSAVAASYWAYMFQRVYETAHTWDYVWTYSCWRRGGLCITPRANLVSNIGFGPEATHTKDPNSFMANMPVEPLAFPLRHPDRLERDAAADDLTETLVFSGTLRRSLAAMRLRNRLAREARAGAA